MFLDPSKLTPGVLDNHAESAFTYGASGALAVAIHDELDWPVYAVTLRSAVGSPSGTPSVLHWVVQHPDGAYVDVDGLHEEARLIERYTDRDAVARVERSSRSEAWRHYSDEHGAPISLDLTATFVAAVLRRAEAEAATVKRLSLKAPR